ncbi:ScbR family autoregulator-binding transcription factor [Streptomyces sp. WAC04114]|uniref:ScbR family autoregulator-binding transcription factor n=1 Tax=Streptomyces sp. WAC04114 TaxID=2867961 RepID=UPI001C8B5919|nr:ScbR family autoregulator-binding transcription factor [Streptomyces sp. WAC04114]MBX9361436.1 TetR family transcriptional regulator [Streptomyces sp. WAC04114]
MTKQDRAVRTRLALIRSAAEQFEARGYVRAGLAEISAGAGVSPGALHFHFANKAAVAEAVEHAAEQALREAAACHRDGDGSALQRLVDVTHHVARLLCADVVVRAGLRLNAEQVAGRVRDLRREWRQCVQGLLTEAEREGELAAGVTPRRTSAVVLAATTGIEVLAREDDGWLARPSLTDLWQLLLPCLAAPCLAGTLDPAGSGSAGSGPTGSGSVGSAPAGPGVQAEAGRVGLAVR